jgi:bifunctional ADP-heptose synthase (sugar kinase/adenylyltransferase)
MSSLPSSATVVELPSSGKRSTPQLRYLLDAISKYRVLVIGDGIVDEYHYVRPLGKSPKENIITTLYEGRKDVFAGGVWAAGAHVKGFCGAVDIATASDFTIKRRYVDPERLRKLFEVHEARRTGTQLDAPDYAAYDLVIVADFGHGCIKQEMIYAMEHRAKFLAVNAQTNSANYGFNLITRYEHADYIVLDELEARLATGDRFGKIEDVLMKLADGRCKKVAITLGPNGSIGFDGEELYRAPGRKGVVVDTMGAGDAFFCVTAPLAAAGATMQLLLQVGNAAGSLKCAVIGHRASVTKDALLSVL